MKKLFVLAVFLLLVLPVVFARIDTFATPTEEISTSTSSVIEGKKPVNFGDEVEGAKPIVEPWETWL